LACSASQRELLLERLGIFTYDYNRRMSLSEKQKKYLRRLGHPLSPIVMLGNAGLTEGVVKELDRALTDHELVKVSARVGARTARDAALDDLAVKTSSEIVQRIGNVGVFYRRRTEMPKILLPDA
jgi:RNA-binding protein